MKKRECAFENYQPPKKEKKTKLGLYQGCHYADDRDGIEKGERNDYSTSTRVKATAE